MQEQIWIYDEFCVFGPASFARKLTLAHCNNL
jgi:hypothetical protein